MPRDSASAARAPLPAYDLRDAVRECCALALRATARWQNDKAVHLARQMLKRARAVLRLLEDAGVRGAKTRRRELAECARQLSPLRDAAVASRLAVQLADRLRSQPQAAALAQARAKVPTRSAKWWRGWRRTVAEAVHNLDRLSDATPAPGKLEQCFRRSVRRVRRQAGKARADDMAAVHIWRKALVILREQVLVVRPLIGRANDRLYTQLCKLTHRLGDATDCRVLLASVEKRRWPASFGRAPEKLAALLRRRQKQAVKRARRPWQKVREVLAREFSRR
jgi:hypothetical protein